MIAYQQTIFGEETPFRMDGMVPAIMFQNKITGRYLANAPIQGGTSACDV